MGEGLYGKGTYFSTQSCKSHQYAAKSTPHTMIIAHVVLGNGHVALQADRKMVRPPEVVGSTSRHDSVIVKRGRMPGHPRGEQTHSEFVIFDSAQAYPEYIVEYTV